MQALANAMKRCPQICPMSRISKHDPMWGHPSGRRGPHIRVRLVWAPQVGAGAGDGPQCDAESRRIDARHSRACMRPRCDGDYGRTNPRYIAARRLRRIRILRTAPAPPLRAQQSPGPAAPEIATEHAPLRRRPNQGARSGSPTRADGHTRRVATAAGVGVSDCRYGRRGSASDNR